MTDVILPHSYYMYFHRVLTGLVFIFTFASIELIFTTIAWKGFGENMWHKLYQFLLENERSLDAHREHPGSDRQPEISKQELLHNEEDETSILEGQTTESPKSSD